MLKNSYKFLQNKAFTLAEILIVLGLIGIVAEITIPTLISNTREQSFKVGYKQAYSDLNYVLSILNSTDSPLIRTAMNTQVDADNFDKLKANFKVVNDCPRNGDNSACWASNTDYYYASHPSVTAPAFIDNSGHSWAHCYGCGGQELFVDVNGLKPPNHFGQDRFPFALNSFNGTGTGGKLVKVNFFRDYLDTSYSGYLNFCPYVANHPCYYYTWIAE